MFVLTLGQAIGLAFVLALIMMVLYVKFIEPRFNKMPDDLHFTKEELERMHELGLDTYEGYKNHLNDLMGYKYLK